MELFHGHFRIRWPVLLAALLVISVGLALGFWQLDRARQKAEWLAQIADRADQPPVTVAALLSRDNPGNYPVRTRGRFDNKHSFLLDNRILEGRAGYHLLTPLRTENGHWVLVNRGWLPRGRSRDRLPEVPDIPGTVTVSGRTYVPSGKAMVLREDPPAADHWPLRIQKVDLRALEGLLGVELAPFEIRVAPDLALERGEQPPRVWHDSRMGPERHRAYAVQWFALAAAALVFFVVAGLRRSATKGDN